MRQLCSGWTRPVGSLQLLSFWPKLWLFCIRVTLRVLPRIWLRVEVITSRPRAQTWEKFVVLQLCLFGLSNPWARWHSVRSKISGTAAWWLMQLSKSWCWHRSAVTNPMVSNAFARWIAQTFGSILKYTYLITVGRVHGKMTWYLCGRKVPITFFGQSILSSASIVNTGLTSSLISSLAYKYWLI